MALHVFVFLFMVCLLLSLALLWHLDWFPDRAFLLKRRGQAHHAPPSAQAPLPRRLSCLSTRFHSLVGAGPAPAPVRPWPQVKSRRGAPKRIDTEGFACPNLQCAYCGITDAQIHALVGDGKHGQAEQIQTFRCQACRTTFSARRDTPLYRLKTPSQQIAVVLAALAEGLDPSAAERVFGSRQATITKWLTRAGKHAELFHEHSFRNLYIPHLQLDEIRTRLRSSTQVRLSVAGYQPLHQASARALSGSPHTTCSAYAHPLPATAFGPWLSTAVHQ